MHTPFDGYDVRWLHERNLALHARASLKDAKRWITRARKRRHAVVHAHKRSTDARREQVLVAARTRTWVDLGEQSAAGQRHVVARCTARGEALRDARAALDAWQQRFGTASRAAGEEVKREDADECVAQIIEVLCTLLRPRHADMYDVVVQRICTTMNFFKHAADVDTVAVKVERMFEVIKGRAARALERAQADDVAF